MNPLYDCRLPQPVLLLSPDGSRDRQGIITPTLDGGVSVVAGQFGNAWQCVAPNPNASGTLSVQSSSTGRWNPVAGTIATRMKIESGNTNISYGIASAGSSPNRAYLGLSSAGNPAGVVGNMNISPTSTLLGEWRTLVMTFDGVNVKLYADGVLLYINTYTGTPTSGAVQSAIVLGYPTTMLVESSVMYDVCLTPLQVQQLFRPRRWTWTSP